MNEILSVALQSMRADMARVDQAGVNLANALTPGYKREVTWASSFPGLVEGGVAAAARTDPRQGTMKATGVGLDLALAGPGWFEVLTERGPAFTRQGSFRADAQGRLVTAEGYPVMGTGGEIRLPPGGAFVVDAAGKVYEGQAGEGRVARAGTQAVAQLKLVQIDGGSHLQRLGAGLFAAPDATLLPADPRTEVRQGYLENSNVNSMHEMVQLLQTLRHFETMQKVALGYDEMLGAAVRKLGDTP